MKLLRLPDVSIARWTVAQWDHGSVAMLVVHDQSLVPFLIKIASS